ncbi:MAG: glycosyltransferase [Candidatus Eisenbacteria bacterium]|nr:glycosyltransferase [Candidatus Eisenbacteria bacterium]
MSGPDAERKVWLSIIFVSYNTRELLVEALRSLQTNPSAYETEVLVVDNASTDGSADEIARLFPRVRILANEKNLGYSKGVNEGIRASKGEFCLVLNPDIRARPGSLDRLLEYAIENPDVGVAGAKLLNPDGSLQYSSRSFYTWKTILFRRTPLGKIFPNAGALREHLMLDWDHRTTRDVDWMLGACLLVRRSAVDDVGLMDERFFLYFEDVDWCYRMKAHGWRVVYVADAVMEHHHRRESARGLLTRQKASHVGSMFRFFDKWSQSWYRLKTRRHWARFILHAAADILVVNLSFFAAYGIRVFLGEVFTKPVFPIATYGTFLLFVNLTTLLSLAATGFYRETDRPVGAGLFVDMFLRALRAAGIAYLVATAATFLVQARIYSRFLVTIFFLLLVVLLPLGRVALHAMYRALRRNAYDLRRAIVVGSNDLARSLAEQMRAFPALGYDVVGFVTEPDETFSGKGFLGTTEDLPRLVRRHRVTDVFCAGSRDPLPLVSRLLLALADAPVSVRVVSDLAAITISRGEAEEFLNLPMLRFERRSLVRYRPGRKRLFDLLFAFAGIVLGLPLFLLLFSAGLAGARPVFAVETRPHIRGAKVRVRKLRVPGPEERGMIRSTLRGFYRALPFAAFYPALFSVLAGRLSFIGPSVGEAEKGRFLDEWQRLVATMRPGLWTSAAVAGYPWVPFRDPVGLNLYYLQHWSVGLDLHIVLREMLRSARGGGETFDD